MIWIWNFWTKSAHLNVSLAAVKSIWERLDTSTNSATLGSWVSLKTPGNFSTERMPSTAASMSCIGFSATWTDGGIDTQDADQWSIQDVSFVPNLCGRIGYLVIFWLEDQSITVLHCTPVNSVNQKENRYIASEDCAGGGLCAAPILSVASTDY
jgi:hypothetical protein